MAFDHACFATLLGHMSGIVCQLEKDPSTASTGLIARHAAIQTAVDGVGAGRILAGVDTVRTAIAAGVQAAAKAMLVPLFREYLHVVVGKRGLEPTTDEGWDAIRAHFITNSYLVTTRNWTRGNVDAGGPENHTNAGSGTCYRLLVDRDNQAIQGGEPGIIEVKCIGAYGAAGDYAATKRYQTRWRAQYRTPASDALARYSAPRYVAPVEFDEMWPKAGYLKNPGFDVGSPGDLSGAPTDWTVETGTATAHDLNGTYYLRKDNEVTPLSLKIVGADFRLSQIVGYRGRTPISRRKPLFRAIARNRETGSYEGTLYLYTGAEATSIALAAQTGWDWLVAAMEDGCWWDGGQEEDEPKIELFSDWTSGDLYVDSFIVSEFAEFDGHFLAVLGGATGDDFQLDDVFTFTDSEAAVGYIQRAICYAFDGRYLPHNTSGAGLIAEPTIA